MTRVLKGFAIFLVIQFVGEAVVKTLDVPIPGNVIGMVLLLLLLFSGLVRVEWVEAAADLLLKHLGLFFVPAGVGVMLYADLLAQQWLPILVAMVLSTFVVMAVTGWVEQLMERQEGGADVD